MNYRNTLTILLSLLHLLAMAQEYAVVSFEPALKDLTARTANTSRVDGNGRKCAVIKVYADDGIAAVRGNVIGDVPATGMEKWIYLSHDSKDMEIVFEHHYPLHITFIDYDIPTVTGQMTYILKLKENETAHATVADTSHTTRRSEDGKKDNGLTPSQLFDRGDTAYRKSDYAEAVKWYRQAAEQGYARAQNQLGYMYAKGYGVPKDDSEAVKWYRKAAEQGHASAQFNLGYKYDDGEGVPKDDAEAIKWYRKAAEQGNMDAQCNLGYMYAHGEGVQQDYQEAVKWYRKAAEQGHASAQNNLGWMYRNGYGVQQDYQEAVKWYRKAAEQGHARAQTSLGYMYEKGYGVQQDYQEAVKWYRKAAEQGNAIAQYNIGLSYEYGRGVTKDLSEARRWYEKAAAQGDADASERLKNL